MDLFIHHGWAVFHAVDDHADAKSSGKERAEQQEVIGRFFPGHEKDDGDNHQNFGIHAATACPFALLALAFTLIYRLSFSYLDFLFIYSEPANM
jgi:hypothetical protein